MSGIILPAGVEGGEGEQQEPVKPVELTEERWPIAVHIQLAPGMPVATIVVPCGDEEQAFVQAWRVFMGQSTTLERLDALQAVEWKRNTDALNGFGDEPSA
jgi:hypothetical protein